MFREIDLTTNKPSANEDATYLIGKAKLECSRYNDTTLSIYFPSGVSTTNKILPLLEELGVKMELYLDLDGESVYLMPEDQIHIAHKVLKFQTKGKNIPPKSVRTTRRQSKN